MRPHTFLILFAVALLSLIFISSAFGQGGERVGPPKDPPKPPELVTPTSTMDAAAIEKVLKDPNTDLTNLGSFDPKALETAIQNQYGISRFSVVTTDTDNKISNDELRSRSNVVNLRSLTPDSKIFLRLNEIVVQSANPPPKGNFILQTVPKFSYHDVEVSVKKPVELRLKDGKVNMLSERPEEPFMSNPEFLKAIVPLTLEIEVKKGSLKRSISIQNVDISGGGDINFGGSDRSFFPEDGILNLRARVKVDENGGVAIGSSHSTELLLTFDKNNPYISVVDKPVAIGIQNAEIKVSPGLNGVPLVEIAGSSNSHFAIRNGEISLAEEVIRLPLKEIGDVKYNPQRFKSVFEQESQQVIARRNGHGGESTPMVIAYKRRGYTEFFKIDGSNNINSVRIPAPDPEIDPSLRDPRISGHYQFFVETPMETCSSQTFFCMHVGPPVGDTDLFN